MPTKDPIDLVFVRGANEPMPAPSGWPNGMMWGVADELNRMFPGRFRFHSTTHRAQYASPQSHGDSVAEAARHLNALLDQLGGAPVVAYSQGCEPAGDIAQTRDDVPCAYLISDPKRPRGANSSGMPGQPGYVPNPALQGWGISGERPIDVARWFALPGDIITDAFADNLVRTFADGSKFVGFAGLNDAGQLAKDIYSRFEKKTWQQQAFFKSLVSRDMKTLWRLPSIAARTVKEGSGYPRIHVAYGREKFPNTGRTYIQEVARRIAIDAGVLRP